MMTTVVNSKTRKIQSKINLKEITLSNSYLVRSQI